MTTGSVIEDLEELKVQQSSSMCYNMAAIKKIIELILIFSISRPDLLCYQSQRTKLIPKNGNG